MPENRAEDTYIPYEATVKAIVESDDSPELFLRSLFANATRDQVAIFCVYIQGVMLDGIDYGIGLADYPDNPVSRTEAYAAGVEEGYQKAQDELP